MLATLTGDLCLLVGLAVLLLPLLATELSRPRDGAWGAVILLLGLVLVTSSDRLRGAPMLAVACGALLISRLGVEVAQARWNQLSSEEQQRLSSSERWTTSVQQLIAAVVNLGGNAGSLLSSIKPNLPSASAAPKREGSSKSGKRWVRPEATATETSTETEVETKTETETKSDTNPDARTTLADSAAPSESDGDAPNPAAAALASVHETTPATEEKPAESKGFAASSKQKKGKGKRWVRPEPEASTPADQASAPPEPQPSALDQPSAAEHPAPLPPGGTDQD